MSDRTEPATKSNTRGTSANTKFRILRIGDRKRAFSFEPIFWSILEAQAVQNHISLNENIERILANGTAIKNHASALRTAAARWLWEKVKITHRQEMSELIECFVRACPLPTFVIDSNKRIGTHNNAFRSSIGATGDASSPAVAEIRFGVPIQRIVDVLLESKGRALSLPVSIEVGAKQTKGVLNATLVGLERGPASLLCIIKTIDPT